MHPAPTIQSTAAVTPQETLRHLADLQSEGKTDAALEGYLALAKTADAPIAAYANFFAGQILLTKNQPQAARPHLQNALTLAQARLQEKAFARLALYSRFQLGIASAMEGKHAAAREEFFRCLEEANNTTEEILLIEQTHLELLRLALFHGWKHSAQRHEGQNPESQDRAQADFDAYFEKEISLHITPFLRDPQEVRAPDGQELASRHALRLNAARALLDAVFSENFPAAGANERLAIQAFRLAGLYIERDMESWLFERARAEMALARYTNALASIFALADKNADAIILETNLYIRMGNEEKALDLLKNSITKAQGGEKRILMSRYAHLLLQARRYAEAAPLLEGLIACKAPGEESDADAFVRRQTLLDLASLALASNDAPLAEQRIRESGVTGSAGMRLLAAALIAQGKAKEAAHSIGQAAAGAHSPREGAELAILEASLAYKTGELEQAQRAAARAEELARLARIPRVEAEALVLAALAINATDPKAAETLLIRAQSIAAANGLIHIEANIRHNLAVLALSSNKNDEAIREFQRASELFDSTRARFALRSEERLQYTASWSETRRFLALAYLAEGRIEEAWETYEHSLARETREALAESLLRSSPDFAESVRAQERALEALQQAHETGAPREEIEKRMRILSEGIQKTERILRAQERGTRGELDHVNLKDFSQALRKNGAAALQYLVWPDEKPGIAFIIDGHGISAAQLPPSDEVLRAAARFREIASRPLLSRVWDAQTMGTRMTDHRMSFITNGLALNTILIEPLYAQNRQVSNLLIIADGELAAFPFAALPLPDERWKDDRNWPACLGDEIPIMTAVSAAAWMEGELLARSTGAVILAGDVGERQIRDGQGERVMPALPGSGREIDGIARIFSRDGVSQNFLRVARGNEATPEKISSLLRKPEGRERSPAILHFATHGFFLPNALTGRPRGALLLADPHGYGEKGAIPRGSIFDEGEIAGLPLVGSLVTLSSCEGARGRVVAGEGMLSLMRAFVIAGVKNVSAALWIIGDDSTAEYMIRYYNHIAAGARPSVAHRDTRRELRELGFWPSQRSGFITSN
jgi:CHAT domain-containing protein/FMN phosphatase YigB (HAD superfamily)